MLNAKSGAVTTLVVVVAAVVLCGSFGSGRAQAAEAFGVPGFSAFTTSSSTTQAGGRADVSTDIGVNRMGPTGLDALNPAGQVRSLSIDLPPGVMGNPNIVPAKCPREVLTFPSFSDQALAACPASAQVGTVSLLLQNYPEDGPSLGGVYVVESLPSEPAMLILAAPGIPVVPLKIRARTESDFGLVSINPDINSGLKLRRAQVTLWAVPGAHTRGNVQQVCFGTFCFPIVHQPEIPPDPIEDRRAFLTNPTVCDGPKVTTLSAVFADDPRPKPIHREWSQDPALANCGDVPFDPSFDLQPTSLRADDATGLEVKLELSQTDDPDTLATSHMRRAEVTLPEGTTFNPSAGDGLAGCTDAQFAKGERDTPATCPAASKIGTVEFDVPLLTGPLKGSIYLGTPLDTDPQSGRMFRVFQYAEGFGLKVKIPGYAKADPVTGRITAVFGDDDVDGAFDPDEGLPQVPFDSVKLTFKGGPNGVLATPSECGTKTTQAVFTPWAVPDPVGAPRSRDVVVESSFEVSRDGAGEPCAASAPFAPKLDAGMTNATARGNGTFAFTLARQDREQQIDGLTAELPPGLLASVKGVPLCSDYRAEQNACPLASQIGTVSAGSGAGSPLFLPGRVYLTEGYKGAPYGLMVAVPAKAGPFDLGTVVVRQAVHVDRDDAHVTAVSDPLPRIWHGIPLRLREIRVDIDRQRFMLNPSSCAAKQVKASVTSTQGAIANLATPFQARACRNLTFKPKLSLRLRGANQTTRRRHPGLSATVRQSGGQAGIERAEVQLPLSLALDPDNAQALCEFVDGTKPEPTCPKGSIIGRAKAVSPLLNEPLEGPVYFVKNVQRHPKTGNLIRKLPMLIVALRGEIAINLRGVSDVKDDRLVNVFDQVPDAPISRFDLHVDGGRNGILVIPRGSICGKQTATALFDGQNGRRHDRVVRIKTPCGGKRMR